MRRRKPKNSKEYTFDGGSPEKKKIRVKKLSPRRKKARKRTPFSCHHTIFHYESFGNEYLLGQKKATSVPSQERLISHVT